MYSVQGSALFDNISVFVIYIFCTGFNSVWWDQRICHICILYRVQLCYICILYRVELCYICILYRVELCCIYILYRVELCYYVFCTGFSSVIMYSVQGWALLLSILYRVELYYYVFCTGLSSPNFINNEKTWWNEVNLVQRTRLFNSFCYFQKFKSFSVNRDNVQVSVNRIKV